MIYVSGQVYTLILSAKSNCHSRVWCGFSCGAGCAKRAVSFHLRIQPALARVITEYSQGREREAQFLIESKVGGVWGFPGASIPAVDDASEAIGKVGTRVERMGSRRQRYHGGVFICIGHLHLSEGANNGELRSQ